MNLNPSINRYLKDKDMDAIDHALGRPMYPLQETYRNHYATDEGSRKAKLFEASPFWTRTGRGAPGGMAFYTVTLAGRQALAGHLAAIGEPHKLFLVNFDGHQWTVPAKSESKAKYKAWLGVSDVWAELTFRSFCLSAEVERYKP